MHQRRFVDTGSNVPHTYADECKTKHRNHSLVVSNRIYQVVAILWSMKTSHETITAGLSHHATIVKTFESPPPTVTPFKLLIYP